MVTDGLKGIGEALGAVFPAATLQTCIVHLIRNSLDYAGWKERKSLAIDIKPMYTAPRQQPWPWTNSKRAPRGRRFPTVVAARRRDWDRVIPYFAFPLAARKLIYTTNAIESLYSQLRKIIKTRGHFPSDDAAAKLIWLGLHNIGRNYGRSVREWREAMNQFAIAYGDRFARPVV